jgi:hypothetical protein
MRKLFVAFLVSVQWLIGEVPPLDHKIASEHFQLACSDDDVSIASTLIENAERAYAKYAIDFQQTPDRPIELFVYPSVEAFQEAMGLHNAPRWMVAHATDHSIHIVSPSNPGPAHNKKNLTMILRLEVAEAFINNLSMSVNPPHWLHFGFAANEAGYFFKRLSSSVPSLELLEKPDGEEFGNAGGYQWSYLFVSYIETKYGKEKVLQLLRNADRFEEIIGLSQEQLYQQWLQWREAART